MDGYNSFSMDFNGDKPRVNEPIPTGTRVLVRLTYTPGGLDIPGTPPEQCTRQLTGSKTAGSDVLYLKAELTVQRGPYRGRKIFVNLTIFGGEHDEQGRSKAAGITRSQIRAMLDSAHGLSTKDVSPEAAAKRVLSNGLASLQGLLFVCKVGVKPEQGQYQASNTLAAVLTIDQKDYPKSEAELDNPVVATAAAKPALPTAAAPVWGAPTTQQAPAPQPAVSVAAAPLPQAPTGFAAPAPLAPTADTATAPAGFTPPPSSAPASAPPAPNAAAPSGLPNWAK